MGLALLDTKSGKTVAVIAADLDAAETLYNGAYPDDEVIPGSLFYPNCDTSRLITSGTKWHVWGANKGEYAISAVDYDDMKAQLLANFSTKAVTTDEIIADYSLLPTSTGGGGGGGGTVDITKTPIGFNVHFGQGTTHPDYTTAAIPNTINVIKQCGGNHCRCDVNMSNSGVPTNASFDPWVTACVAAGISIMVVVSVSSATGTTPDTSSNAAIQAQYDAQYNLGYAKMFGFMTTYRGKVTWLCHGSELDVLDQNGFKLQHASGSGPLSNGSEQIGDPTGSGTPSSPYRWANANNAGGVLAWDCTRQGIVFYFIKGMIDGANAACAAGGFASPYHGMNYASYHTGRQERFCKDFRDRVVKIYSGAQGTPTTGSLKTTKILDWVGNDWYSQEENGTDSTKYVYTTAVSMKNTAAYRLKKLFKDKGYCTMIGFTECGFKNLNTGGTEPYNGTTQFLFQKLLVTQYWPYLDFIIFYEAGNEPNARSTSTTGEQYLGQQTLTIDVLTTPDPTVTGMKTIAFYPKPTA